MKVNTSIDDGIATITIDRPEVRNAIDVETVAGIRAGFEEAATAGRGRPSSRVPVRRSAPVPTSRSCELRSSRTPSRCYCRS